MTVTVDRVLTALSHQRIPQYFRLAPRPARQYLAALLVELLADDSELPAQTIVQRSTETFASRSAAKYD